MVVSARFDSDRDSGASNKLKEGGEYGPSYWDGVVSTWTDAAPLAAWRAYMAWVYLRLMDPWLPLPLRRNGLKTDLFEEAISSDPLLTQMGPQSIGIDCSAGVVEAARRRLNAAGESCRLMVGDLRRLPIRSSSRRYVLCGSSLDHFSHFHDIAVCLAELNRVLVPGGIAIITFDNPHNPVVWLRNHLPFPLLKRIGIVPYYVGHTYTRRMAEQQLQAAGFEVFKITAVAHAPRAPAIALIALLERIGQKTVATQTARRVLQAFERFDSLPTRFRTGYYLACFARKRCDLGPRDSGWMKSTQSDKPRDSAQTGQQQVQPGRAHD